MKRADGKAGDGLAVALHWDRRDAPRVVAKGRDALAERIVAAAEAAGVEQYADPQLAGVLAQVPLGEEIPETLYRAVAEVIAFTWWVAGRTPEPGGGQPRPARTDPSGKRTSSASRGT
ncbi:MAG: EscU/YscU/HrcU family type III secretion system export apparatus switch protein [Pseudomonadales bacterium]|jgi:flagellar biosynthesis protein|nr:EscU/YscU/HrcU family type III secretion system export apparatus switch protein [Pseudomonadales bacterium]